jgi:two-component system phosphate regulon sensor histidine kinase PhoR
MKPQKSVYRKNYSLIIAFLVLISITFVIALMIAYNLTSNYVENEFATKKIDVLEKTVKPYNDFFLNKIPEITLYQGYLTSVSAADYSVSVFKAYPFVREVVFYDISIGSKTSNSKAGNNLAITINSVYEYQLHNGSVKGTRKSTDAYSADFEYMANKLSDYITYSDTSRGTNPDEIFKTYYDVKPDKISYMNILRREDVKIYRELQNHIQPGVSYKQNMMTFLLDPYILSVKN